MLIFNPMIHYQFNIIIFLHKYQTIGSMLNWLLIISITMVSTTILMFASAFLAILPQTQQYYKKDRSDVLLLLNSFNIVYIVITPFIFTSLKKHFSLLVNISLVLIGVGCIGRYLCKTDYNMALFMSSLVAIGHIPIITAPYGLLDLFSESQKGYAASIPLFVPTLGINFCILYGMTYVASEYAVVVNFSQAQQIDNLNLIIALVGSISCIFTFLLMKALKKQIERKNEIEYLQKNKASSSQSWISIIKNQFMGGKQQVIMICSWGVLLGINWTYGGLFGVFLGQTGLTHKDIALVGLFANLSSVVFSNVGNWISNTFKLPNTLIIFILNMGGFFASLYIQASTVIDGIIFQNKINLIIWVIVLRAGFSSFVSLALIQLSHCGSSVLVSSIFFYISNAVNLGANLLVDRFQNWISLALISGIIWICIFLVFVAQFSNKVEDAGKQKSKIELKEEEETSSIKMLEIQYEDAATQKNQTIRSTK